MPDKPDFDQEQVARLETRRQATGRQCGKCTMCCTLMGVDEPPHLTKPPNTKCQHCVPGKGCTIYERRPDTCRGFYCQWLVNPQLDDLLYPLTAKIVTYIASFDGNSNLAFTVDPHRPDRWLQHPYFERISNLALAFPIPATVRAHKHWYMLLPRVDADGLRKSTINWCANTVVHFKPDWIGPPGYIKSPRGDFRWVELIPPAEFFDAWRSG
jgi:hypothetical protein